LLGCCLLDVFRYLYLSSSPPCTLCLRFGFVPCNAHCHYLCYRAFTYFWTAVLVHTRTYHCPGLYHVQFTTAFSCLPGLGLRTHTGFYLAPYTRIPTALPYCYHLRLRYLPTLPPTAYTTYTGYLALPLNTALVLPVPSHRHTLVNVTCGGLFTYTRFVTGLLLPPPYGSYCVHAHATAVGFALHHRYRTGSATYPQRAPRTCTPRLLLPTYLPATTTAAIAPTAPHGLDGSAPPISPHRCRWFALPHWTWLFFCGLHAPAVTAPTHYFRLRFVALLVYTCLRLAVLQFTTAVIRSTRLAATGCTHHTVRAVRALPRYLVLPACHIPRAAAHGSDRCGRTVYAPGSSPFYHTTTTAYRLHHRSGLCLPTFRTPWVVVRHQYTNAPRCHYLRSPRCTCDAHTNLSTSRLWFCACHTLHFTLPTHYTLPYTCTLSLRCRAAPYLPAYIFPWFPFKTLVLYATRTAQVDGCTTPRLRCRAYLPHNLRWFAHYLHCTAFCLCCTLWTTYLCAGPTSPYHLSHPHTRRAYHARSSHCCLPSRDHITPACPHVCGALTFPAGFCLLRFGWTLPAAFVTSLVTGSGRYHAGGGAYYTCLPHHRTVGPTPLLHYRSCMPRHVRSSRLDYRFYLSWFGYRARGCPRWITHLRFHIPLLFPHCIRTTVPGWTCSLPPLSSLHPTVGSTHLRCYTCAVLRHCPPAGYAHLRSPDATWTVLPTTTARLPSSTPTLCLFPHLLPRLPTYLTAFCHGCAALPFSYHSAHYCGSWFTSHTAYRGSTVHTYTFALCSGFSYPTHHHTTTPACYTV